MLQGVVSSPDTAESVSIQIKHVEEPVPTADPVEEIVPKSTTSGLSVSMQIGADLGALMVRVVMFLFLLQSLFLPLWSSFVLPSFPLPCHLAAPGG